MNIMYEENQKEYVNKDVTIGAIADLFDQGLITARLIIEDGKITGYEI